MIGILKKNFILICSYNIILWLGQNKNLENIF